MTLNGGGVYVEAAGSFTMSGGTIWGNKAMGNKGGGVYVKAAGSSFTKSGGGIIYGDTNNTYTAGNDENPGTQGHAVFYDRGGGNCDFRDLTLGARA